MRCTSPRIVGFKSDGKTLSWSNRTNSKEFDTMQMPCGKCIECKLEYARTWAIRCMHEAKCHSENCFITLTYNDENLTEGLKYSDFQNFAKKLRDKIFKEKILDRLYPSLSVKQQKEQWKKLTKEERRNYYEPYRISIFVTGEYGEKNKRPHWHAIIFNWQPDDAKPKYTNHRGDKVYTSSILDTLWGNGITEFGSVTYQSASYCARYGIKDLVHEKEKQREFRAISKRSSHIAIGKRFLERYWRDIFTYGYVEYEGQKLAIPRYYEKWLKKHHPLEWEKYVTTTRQQKINIVKKMASIEREEYLEDCYRRGIRGATLSRNDHRRKIAKQRQQQLLQSKKL